MSTSEEVKENLLAQIRELEVLQSIYPDELTIGDQGVLADVNDFLAHARSEIPQRLEYSVAVPISRVAVELLVNLPLNYPKTKPEIYARSSALGRTQQMELNKSLAEFCDAQEKGEPCVYELIAWLKDSAKGYIKSSAKNQTTNGNDKKVEDKNRRTFARYWVYSHHIFNKFKRRDIVDTARANALSGFCLAGKPGIICIEGALENCEDWWQTIKVMNWHKIHVKLIEEESTNGKSLDSLRKFSGFQEVYFPSSDRHNDMGQLLKYLTDHNSQHVFKEYFGLEGKSAQITNC